MREREREREREIEREKERKGEREREKEIRIASKNECHSLVTPEGSDAGCWGDGPN